MLARRQVQHVGERRQDHRGDREHEQARDHPRGLAAEAQHAVVPAAGEEGEAEDEERVREDRADERGLDDSDEPGLEREDGDEELGQVADRRLDDAGRGRGQVIAELVGRFADQVGDAGERHGRDREGRERGGAGEVQHAGEPDRRAGGGRHHQVAACDRCRHWRCPSRPSPRLARPRMQPLIARPASARRRARHGGRWRGRRSAGSRRSARPSRASRRRRRRRAGR